MLFLLNFTQFDAIIANFETHFAYSETDFANFETKIPDLSRGFYLLTVPEPAEGPVSRAKGPYTT